MGVASPIDVRIYIRITQEGQMRIGWNVAKWVDAGRLHSSVPYVAEDIRRKEGRGEEADQPAGGGTDKDDDESPAVHWPVENNPDRHQVEQRLVHRDQAETDDKMMDLVHSLATEAHQQKPQQCERTIGRPRPGAGAGFPMRALSHHERLAVKAGLRAPAICGACRLSR